MKNQTYRTWTLFSALFFTAFGAPAAEAMRRYHHNATPIPGDEAPFPCAMAQHQPLPPSPASSSSGIARQRSVETERARQDFGPSSPSPTEAAPAVTLLDRLGAPAPGTSLADRIPALLSTIENAPSISQVTTSTAPTTRFTHPLAHPLYGLQDCAQTTPYTLRPVLESDITPPQDPATAPDFFYMGDVPFALWAKIDAHIRNVVGSVIHQFWVLEDVAGDIKGYFDYRDEVTVHLHKALHGQGIARQVHRHLLTYFGQHLQVPTLKISPVAALGHTPMWDEDAIDALTQASPEAFSSVFKAHTTATSIRYAGFQANLCYPNAQALALFAEGMSIKRCREAVVEAVFPPRPDENPRVRTILTQLIAVNTALRGTFITHPVEGATTPTRETLESTRATLISALRGLEENDDALPEAHLTTRRENEGDARGAEGTSGGSSAEEDGDLAE